MQRSGTDHPDSGIEIVDHVMQRLDGISLGDDALPELSRDECAEHGDLGIELCDLIDAVPRAHLGVDLERVGEHRDRRSDLRTET
jgi:hypothetical protein